MDPNEVQVTSLEEAKVHIASLSARLRAVEGRLRLAEKQLDTRSTPLWKRIVFRVDGWPSWWIVAERPAWRPWRRWWRS